MTTPAFVPQDSSSLTTIRYYTPFDTYYYSVDNRPLEDIASNLTTISEGGGDSGRRGTLLTQLALSEVFRAFGTNERANTVGYITGLDITTPGSNTIRVNPGAFYIKDLINMSNTTNIYKQALLLGIQDFTAAPPTITGNSISYLLQIKNTTLDTSSMATSALPYVDSTNTFLPSVLLNGELSISIKAGTSAVTGSQVTPSPDSGWTPLYAITATYGSSVPTITFAANAPAAHRLSMVADYDFPQTDAASKVDIAGVTVASLPEGSKTSIAIPVPVGANGINPFAPVKITLVYSTSIANGDVALQSKYLALNVGSSTAGSVVSLTEEVIAAPTTANTIATATLTGMIPNTAFAGFSSGNWGITAAKVFLTLTRNGASAADTATGNLLIHDVIVSQ